MNLSLIAILLSSVMGSAHCLLMCGGVATACHNSPRNFGYAQYQFGRLFSYTALGAIAGSGGGVLGKFSPWAVVVMAIALVAYGMLGIFGVRFRSLSSSTAAVSRVVLNLVKKTPFMVGIASAFLPCGWLYSFVAFAAVQGSPLQGAFVMATFWCGTFIWLSVPIWTLHYFKRFLGGQRIMYALVAVSGIFIITEHLIKLSAPHQSNNSPLQCSAH